MDKLIISNPKDLDEITDILLINSLDLNKKIKELDNIYEIWKTFYNPYNNNKTRFLVSTHGRVYDTKYKKIVEPYIREHTTKTNKYGETRYYKCKPRYDIRINDKQSGTNLNLPLARLVLMVFEPLENYKGMEADHLDANTINNHYSNLEWVTHKENMRRAKEKYMNNFIRKEGQIGGFCPCYTNEFIHKICKAICDGLSRKEIREKFNINGQLIDDIKSGRSHKDVSIQYVDKGFKYKEFTKEQRNNKRKQVKKICELIDLGFTNSEIVKYMDLPNNEICLPNDIRKLRIYRYISKDYNFGKDITQTYFKERI